MNQYTSPSQPSPQNPEMTAPTSPSQSKPKFPVISFIIGMLAGFVGMVGFLIAGIRGHSAGWELMAIPTLITFGLALPAFVGAIMALIRKSWIGGILTIGAAGFGSLLALVGFFLGA